MMHDYLDVELHQLIHVHRLYVQYGLHAGYPYVHPYHDELNELINCASLLHSLICYAFPPHEQTYQVFCLNDQTIHSSALHEQIYHAFVLHELINCEILPHEWIRCVWFPHVLMDEFHGAILEHENYLNHDVEIFNLYRELINYELIFSFQGFLQDELSLLQVNAYVLSHDDHCEHDLDLRSLNHDSSFHHDEFIAQFHLG